LKILFINKYDVTGGAGVAAFRLHKALEKEYKTTNRFLVGIKKSNFPYVFPTRKPGIQNFIERGLNFLSNQIGLQYKFHPFSSRTIMGVANNFAPDIISLHNAHGGYFKTSLLIELSKIAPVVWTLHDMWAFTANAAHTFGDNSYKNLKSGKGENKLFPQIGLNTGNWLLNEKKKIFLKSNLTIVTPSRWLYELASQSPVFKDKKIVHIPNGIDLNIFRPLDKSAVRSELGIPVNAKVLIFGAEKVMAGNYKGGQDLVNILMKLDSRLEQKKIHLIIIGESNLKKNYQFKNFEIHETGYLFEEEKMAKYLSVADIFVYPTKADNLPNALIEASASGTPAVTYDVGGCSEIVVDGESGFVIPPFDVDRFVDKVMSLLLNDSIQNEQSRKCRLIAEEKFDSVLMCKEYYKLFSALRPAPKNYL
jgi:glycosyltransferase involved in cell wall biosynthesis